MPDPHTGAELSVDDIVDMCDELIEAHAPPLRRAHPDIAAELAI